MPEDSWTRQTEYVELFDETMKKHVLSIFKKHIRDRYYVKDLVKIDGKWVLKMEKRWDVPQNPGVSISRKPGEKMR